MNTLPESTGEAPATVSDLVQQGRFREVLERFEANPAIRLTDAKTEYHIAFSAARVSEYGRANLLAVSALRRFVDEANQTGQLQTINLLGGIAFEQGRLEEAEHWFKDARHLAGSMRDIRMQAKTGNNLAMILHLRGRAHQAIDVWRSALQLYESLGDLTGSVQTHYNLSLAFRELDLLHTAREHAWRAAALVEHVTDPALTGLVSLGMAELAFAECRYERAAELLVEATALAQSSGDQSGQVTASRLRALMSLATRDFPLARVEAAAARDVAERVGARVLAAECGVIHALALASDGDVRRADPLYRRAVEGLERMGAARLTRWADREWTRISAGA
jgi:tetratricopeptide (TPR) repeat protein